MAFQSNHLKLMEGEHVQHLRLEKGLHDLLATYPKPMSLNL